MAVNYFKAFTVGGAVVASAICNRILAQAFFPFDDMSERDTGRAYAEVTQWVYRHPGARTSVYRQPPTVGLWDALPVIGVGYVAPPERNGAGFPRLLRSEPVSAVVAVPEEEPLG